MNIINFFHAPSDIILQYYIMLLLIGGHKSVNC